MIGLSMGSPIMPAPPNDLLSMAITKGSEDRLSLNQDTRLGVRAAGAASRMPALADAPPAFIQCTAIGTDDDHGGGLPPSSPHASTGIPLHTNGSERHPVPSDQPKGQRRTRSDFGRDCRDAFLGLTRTAPNPKSRSGTTSTVSPSQAPISPLSKVILATARMPQLPRLLPILQGLEGLLLTK